MNITQADIDRWRAEGHPDQLIENWVKNIGEYKSQAHEVAEQMISRYQRIAAQRGQKPDADLAPKPSGPDCPRCPDCPDCPRCQNKRYIHLVDQNGNYERTPCPDCRGATVDQWRAKSLQKYSAANGRAKDQTFANFKPDRHPTIRAACEAARSFAAEPHCWFVLHGDPGTGKSHLCAAIANSLIDRAQAAIFVTMPQLASSLKRLFDEQAAAAEGETYYQRKDVYATAPVLIVDDIGAGTFTDWDAKVLFDILDPRYTNQLPTVLVSNLDMTDSDVFDPRLVDRWTERGFSTVVQVVGPSHRNNNDR